MQMTDRMAAVAAASELEAVSVRANSAGLPDGAAQVWEAAVLSAWRRAAWIALQELLEAIGDPFGDEIFINPIDAQRWIESFGVWRARQAAQVPYAVEWPYSLGWEIQEEVKSASAARLNWD